MSKKSVPFKIRQPFLGYEPSAKTDNKLYVSTDFRIMFDSSNPKIFIKWFVSLSELEPSSQYAAEKLLVPIFYYLKESDQLYNDLSHCSIDNIERIRIRFSEQNRLSLDNLFSKHNERYQLEKHEQSKAYIAYERYQEMCQEISDFQLKAQVSLSKIFNVLRKLICVYIYV